MIRNISYRGPLVIDTTVPGEAKADGHLPGHPGSGAIQLSKDRWIFFYATLDPRGWDASRSIVYQIRVDSPTGPLVTEKLVDKGIDDYPVEGDTRRFRKGNHMPIVFGVPMGAKRNGRLMVNHNRFVVKWVRHAILLGDDGTTYTSEAEPHLVENGVSVKNKSLRVEWMQFEYDPATDDIRILHEPCMMRQSGFASGDHFCIHSPCFMNHAMTSPVAEDGSCLSWVEVDTFGNTTADPHKTHGKYAAVRFRFNEQTRLYEWTDTGPLTWVEEQTVGESTIGHFNGEWLIATRSFSAGGSTFWYRTKDPFTSLGEPVRRDGWYCPRFAYRCGDGVLRLFMNFKSVSPYDDRRNPMYVFDVNPGDFSYSEPRLVFDAHAAKLPFKQPFVDMGKLCQPHDGKQIMLFRMIGQAQTSNLPNNTSITDAEHEQAGIHHVEIEYDEPVPDEWQF